MNVVTNHFMLKYFKSISIFKLDLGSNLRGPVQQKADPENTIKIKDEFIKKYNLLNGNSIIRKFGDIGKLNFYEDGDVPHNEFHIYDDDKIYEICVTQEDLKKDAAIYLAEIIQKLGKEVVEENISVQSVKNTIYTNMPDEIKRPDINMPKDQYIEAIINRRKMLDELI